MVRFLDPPLLVNVLCSNEFKIAVVRRLDRIDLGTNATRRGRPRLILDIAIRKNTSTLNLNEHVTHDRAQ